MAFPKTVSIEWDANPVGDNVTSYSVSVNGSPVGTTSGTSQLFSVPSAGTYTASVVATNGFGDGPAGQAILVAAVPGQVATVHFVVPA